MLILIACIVGVLLTILTILAFAIAANYASKLALKSKEEASKKIKANKDWRDDEYEFREIMRPKYYGLCGAVKVRQRRLFPFSGWEDI